MSQQSETSPIKEEKQEQQPQPLPPTPPPPLPPPTSSQEKQQPERSPQAEEKRPLETSGKEEDVHSSKERKTKEADSPAKARDRNRDSGLVLPPEPYVPRLLNDTSLQIGLLRGFLHYYGKRGVFPFSNQNSLQDFLTNWLQVSHVQISEFLEAVKTLWKRHKMTAIAIGESLQSLYLVDREIFLLCNRILTLQADDDADIIRNVPSVDENKGKSVKIGDAVTVTDEGKGVENVDYVAATDKGKGVKNGDSDQPEKKDDKGKGKEKMVFLFKRKEKTNKYVILVKGKEKVDEEKKPITVKESEEKASQGFEQQPLSAVDTDSKILHGLIDYFFTHKRYPFDDNIAMEDFVKNWVKMDISVFQCVRIIKKLKRRYKKQVISAGPQDPHAQHIFNLSEVIWTNENPYDSSEGELSDDNVEEEAKEVPVDEKQHLPPTFGNEDLDRELGMYGFGYGDLQDLMPIMVKSTIMNDPATWLSSLMAPYNPIPLAVLPPIRTSDDSNKQKDTKPGDTVHGDDVKPASTLDTDDPASLPAAPVDIDDPGQPQDQVDDGGHQSTEKQTSSQEQKKEG